MSGARRYFIILLALILLTLGFQTGHAIEKAAYDEPNFQIDIGQCTWNGTKSITSVTFTLTNTRAEIYMPSGAFFRLTMSNPVVTVDLESGVYNYVWLDDYDPVFYTWLTRVEGSFTLGECRPQASASISVGSCSWDEAHGSVTPVTITLDHAQLTLNGTLYTAVQTVITDLAPGSYVYSWVGVNGYEGGESNLTLVIPDCTPTPANVSIEVGACNWTEQEGSTTRVELSISGASLVITGSGTSYGPYTSDTTLSLKDGHYTYTWTALPDYTGSGSGVLNIEDCEPEFATASVGAGPCVWDDVDGSTFLATITLENATLTIDSITYTESTTIQLPCGSYSYTWTAKSGYQGSGSGLITVEGCEPATVESIVGVCDWVNQTSLTPVTLNVYGATLTLSDSSGVIGTYGPGSHTLDLPTGSYAYVWVANENFEGTGSGSFETLDCEPGKADVSLNVGACAFDEGKSLTAVTINVSGAVLTINGQNYFENAEIKLEPGPYPYSWTAVEGYEGSGDGTLVIEGCQPASVDVLLGVCDWVEETSLTSVTLIIHGATLTISNSGSAIGTFGPGTYVIDLPIGSYSYAWIANEDYIGSGEGNFETLDCEPGKADASVSVGACTYDDGVSLTLVSININGAVLTINGQEFFENDEIKLEAGEYPYTWEAIEGFQGSGEGIITAKSCEPKVGEDPSPDIAAGGTGPVLIPTIVLFPLSVFGAGISWLCLKQREKES